MDKDIQAIKAKAEQIYEKFKSYFVFQVEFGANVMYVILTSNKFFRRETKRSGTHLTRR